MIVAVIALSVLLLIVLAILAAVLVLGIRIIRDMATRLQSGTLQEYAALRKQADPGAKVIKRKEPTPPRETGPTAPSLTNEQMDTIRSETYNTASALLP